MSEQSFGRIVPERLLETHLAIPLFGAQRARASGTLTVDEGSVQTRLHLLDGKVVYAEQGTLAETLGRLLVRRGILDREEYLVILEHMSEPSAEDAVLRFGDVAIRLGMLTAGELNEALELQVRFKLQHCLTLDEGFWQLEAARPPSARYPVQLEPALLGALREDPQAHRWAGLLIAKRHRVLRLNGDAGALGQRFGCTPPQQRLLRLADGRPLADALQSELIPPAETGVVLAALILAGALELDHVASERLDATRTAKLHERIAAERARAPTDPPDAEADRAQAAAERLREEMRRRGHRGGQSRLDAERAFEKGRKLLSRGAVAAALEEFQNASQLLPEAAEYELYLAWCRFADEDDPVHRNVFEQTLRAAALEALRQDRKMAFAHYVQGRLLLDDEDLNAAERAFKLASRLDPSHVEAERYLRVVQRRNK